MTDSTARMMTERRAIARDARAADAGSIDALARLDRWTWRASDDITRAHARTLARAIAARLSPSCGTWYDGSDAARNGRRTRASASMARPPRLRLPRA